MDQQSITEQLTDVFHDVFGDESIVLHPGMTAEEVDGWDSLNNIRLLVSVEKAFGVKFSAAERGDLQNVGELIALIKRRVDAAA